MNYMPHGYCISWDPMIIWPTVVADLTIALAYFAIPLLLVKIRKLAAVSGELKLFINLFEVFIILCGMTHVMDAVMFWVPLYYLNAVMRLATSIASILTLILLIPATAILAGYIRHQHASMKGLL